MAEGEYAARLDEAAGSDSSLRLPGGSSRSWWAALTITAMAGLSLLLVWQHIGRPVRFRVLFDMAAAAITLTIVWRAVLGGRPVTGVHAVVSGSFALVALLAADAGQPFAAAACLVASGWVLIRPSNSTTEPGALTRVQSLVDDTHDDPLAPFAMAAGKSYVFSSDSTAALAYRALGGLAVVSGDPIGDVTKYPQVISRFCALCRTRGWHIVVLGASRGQLSAWRDAPGIGHRLTAVPIGRDVVIETDTFNLSGRTNRNLRQAVNRTHNAGITTEVVAERELDSRLRAELIEIMRESGRTLSAERGFAMMLGDALSGHYGDVWLIIARDRHGQAQGFHRYVGTGGGSDLSLEIPWRRTGAPNGIDERLTVDMVVWAKARRVQRVSLAFAPFPGLFAKDGQHRIVLRVARVVAHAGDRFIKLESLYRYVRKFHAMRERRYVLVPLTHLPTALVVLLRLEFGRHRSPASDEQTA
jgi:lysylphosphatidylglycerol synthetase-like protein (DUF2156 family)